MTIDEAYNILNANREDPIEYIKSIWKKLTLKYHPDKNFGISEELNAEYIKRFKIATEAWKYLQIHHIQFYPKYSDNTSSQSYNKGRRQSSESTNSGSYCTSDFFSNSAGSTSSFSSSTSSREFNQTGSNSTRNNNRQSRDLYYHYSEPSNIKCDKCGIVKKRDMYSKNMIRKRKFIRINNHLAKQTGGQKRSAFIVCNICTK